MNRTCWSSAVTSTTSRRKRRAAGFSTPIPTMCPQSWSGLSRSETTFPVYGFPTRKRTAGCPSISKSAAASRSGALSAPFSIACELVGSEPLLMAMLDRPEWVGKLLSFSSEVNKAYGKAFVERGLGVILFDSHASPPLTSAALYEKIILSPTTAVIRYFRSGLGVPLVPYIMGGDTTSLLKEIIATGTNNILCDHKADLNVFVERLKEEPVLLRANIDPLFLTTQPLESIRAKAREVLSTGRRHPRFLMGTGILPYDIAPERVIAVREAINAWRR
jgi:uroporphyrinogen decarboxylase